MCVGGWGWGAGGVVSLTIQLSTADQMSLGPASTKCISSQNCNLLFQILSFPFSFFFLTAWVGGGLARFYGCFIFHEKLRVHTVLSKFMISANVATNSAFWVFEVLCSEYITCTKISMILGLKSSCCVCCYLWFIKSSALHHSRWIKSKSRWIKSFSRLLNDNDKIASNQHLKIFIVHIYSKSVF